MKKTIFVSIVLMCLLLASNGVARQGQSVGSQQIPKEPGMQEQQTSESRQQLHWSQRASDILDKKIMSNDGKELGTAKDFVIGRDGKIEYVILSVGGFLGIGSERIVLPWDKIRATPNFNLLMADVSEAEIQWHTEVADSGGTQQAAESRGKEQSMPLAQMDSARANEFIGRTVAGNHGEKLGKMTDLLTSENGEPMYVVIQSESGQLHPVPGNLILADPKDKSLSADFDKQAFQSSPSYDRSQLSQQQWESEVRGYYQAGPQGGQSGKQPPPTGDQPRRQNQ